MNHEVGCIATENRAFLFRGEEPSYGQAEMLLANAANSSHFRFTCRLLGLEFVPECIGPPVPERLDWFIILQ